MGEWIHICFYFKKLLFAVLLIHHITFIEAKSVQWPLHSSSIMHTKFKMCVARKMQRWSKQRFRCKTIDNDVRHDNYLQRPSSFETLEVMSFHRKLLFWVKS